MKDTNQAVDLSFARHTVAGQEDCIAITARDNVAIIARLELTHEDFSKLLTGETVVARFSRGMA